MTGTILFDLQAAVMAANPGQTGTSGDIIPADGVSFSEILMAQTNTVAGTPGGSDDADIAAGAADAAVSGGFGAMLEAAVKKIEEADEGVKKAMQMLLKTVINAMKGAKDGEPGKTDMFMILSDGSAGLFGGEDENDILLGAGILDSLGTVLDGGEYAKTDSVFDMLDRFIAAVFGKDEDDTDENTAAEVLAAMLSVQPEEIGKISEASGEVRAEAVESAVNTLKAAMETIAQEAPEKAEAAEVLFAEFVDGNAAEDDKPVAVSVSFAAIGVRNAEEQISSIAVKDSRVTETVPTEEDIPAEELAETEENVPVMLTEAAETDDTVKADGEVVRPDTAVTEVKTAGVRQTDKTEDDEPAPEAIPEIAAAGAKAETAVFEREIPATDTELDVRTAVSVENQLTERLNTEIADFDAESGTKELVLILRPRELGQVAVKLIKEGGGISVMMSAQYSEVGKLMTQRAEQMGTSLSNENTVIRDIRVVEPGSAAEQMGLSFTDHGFSFARNDSRSGSGRSGGSYGETDETGGIEAADSILDIREAKQLWTTA